MFWEEEMREWKSPILLRQWAESGLGMVEWGPCQIRDGVMAAERKVDNRLENQSDSGIIYNQQSNGKKHQRKIQYHKLQRLNIS